jgi:hypothetical protein
MTFRTHFRCYECRSSHFTKQALSEYQGHLICQTCFDKKPKQQATYFDVTYLTKRGLQKSTTLRVDTEQEARTYIFEKKNAKEIVSLVCSH